MTLHSFEHKAISPKSATLNIYQVCFLIGWLKTFFSPVQSNIKPNYVPRRGTYSFCSCSREACCVMREAWCVRREAWGVRREAWGVRRPQLTLSDHLKKMLSSYHHQSLCTYIGCQLIAWLVLIFSNFWKKTRWPPQPIFHKYCSTNYSNAVQAIVSRFDVQVSNHNTLLVFLFFRAIKLKQNGRLDGACKFCWLSIFDDVRSIKGKVMNISSPNFSYGYMVA